MTEKGMEENQQEEASVSGPGSCPVVGYNADSDKKKKMNLPIQAKKFVPTQVRPTVLQEPGEKMDEFCYTEIVDCPVVENTLDRLGKWLGPLNLVPFFNAIVVLYDNIKAFRKKHAMFPNDPCIRCNMGKDCVILVGNTAVHWLISQPLENVDRDRPKWGFGPFQLGDHYFGKSIPCLISSERDGHSKTRKLLKGMFQSRFAEIDSMLENTFTHRLNQLIDGFAKDKTSTDSSSSSNWLSGYFCTMWLLAAEPPCNKFLVEYGAKSLAKPGTDNWIGGFIGQILVDVIFTLDGSYRRQDELVQMVRTSRYYKQYESMAKDLGVEMQDLDKNITYSICLSGNLGISLPFSAVVAALGENLGSLSEIREEIGMDHLTIKSVTDETKYPLLDALVWEVKRAYLRGQLVPRRAKKDLLVPGGNQKAYRIKKNDLMIGYYPISNRDPRVFDDPDRFNPRRFYDNPELKKYVFSFGMPFEFEPEHAEWGCPIYAMGFGDQLLKVFIGKWIQRVDWSLAQIPEFTGNAIGEFRPYCIPYAKLQYREAYLKSLKQP